MIKSAVAQIDKAIAKAHNIALIGHAQPDGDSIGSMLGLALALEGRGKTVTRLSSDPIPETYYFLPGADKVIDVNTYDYDNDLLIVVDCTDIERCQSRGKINWPDTQLINIDHHISNKYFGSINLVEPQASATGEVIYSLLKALDWGITTDMATCLYTAIVMDTGSFTYSNTTPATHHITGALMNLGLDIEKLNTLLFEEKPVLALQLLCKALGTLHFDSGGKISLMKILRSTMIELGANDEHADGLVNYCKSIKGVELGMVFRELEGKKIKISLRSKSLLDVNQLASVFGGGGHPRAAGCLVEGVMDEVIDNFVHEAEKMLTLK